MRKSILAAALLVAVSAFAGATVFTKYESTRQAFLAGSLKDVQTNAAALATDARAAKQEGVAKLADAVAKSPDLDKARVAFAALSDELIKRRADAKNAKPSVYHCPMVNKSWLQPKGKVGNPYDSSMVMCGLMKEE
jgi:hypothetical protein